jgi:hypothetical protein
VLFPVLEFLVCRFIPIFLLKKSLRSDLLFSYSRAVFTFKNEKLITMYSICSVMFAAAKRNIALRWVVWRAAEK